jgi:hypothetical protein
MWRLRYVTLRYVATPHKLYNQNLVYLQCDGASLAADGQGRLKFT